MSHTPYERTEADESNYGKHSALTNLFLIVCSGESMGVIAMYERAALKQGATLDETELTIRTARLKGEKP